MKYTITLAVIGMLLAMLVTATTVLIGSVTDPILTFLLGTVFGWSFTSAGVYIGYRIDTRGNGGIF